MLLNAGQHKLAFDAGRADFFAGRIRIPQRHPDDAVPKPVNAWELWNVRNTLTGVQEAYFNGYFEAREQQMRTFEGTSPPSTRPMPTVHTAVAAVAAARKERQMPRRLRRKHGDEVVTIHVNAAGSTLRWRKHVFDLDAMSDADKGVLLSNLGKLVQPQG